MGDGDTTFAAIEQSVDAKKSSEVQLSENKIEDVVTVSHGNVIANDDRTILAYLGFVTGWMYTHERNVNTVLVGPSAGGKTQVQKTVTKLLPSDLTYEATDQSGSAIEDDDSWEDALVAPLDEWQKIPDSVTEIIKSLAGEDEQYVKKRSVSDDDSNTGRTTIRIVKKAKPYSFLYAQHSMDHELSTRLLKLPVEDNEKIREAIGRKEFGHTDITIEGYETDFIFDTNELESALREHLRQLPTKLDDPVGGMEKGQMRGGSYAKLPPWVWYTCETIFDPNRVETNRVFGMVANLIRASAVLNSDNRGTVEKEVDGEMVQAYLVESQDVANVLRCRETLLGTTHDLDDTKLKVLEAVESNSGISEEAGCTVGTVKDYLAEDSSVSPPRKQKLRELLQELEEHYYLNIREGAGENGAHLYEFRSKKHISPPRISNLESHMKDAEIEETKCLYDEVGSSFDLDNPFANADDPITGKPFTEMVEEMRQQRHKRDVERRSQESEMADGMSITDAMGGGDDDDSGGVSLEDFGGSGDKAESEAISIDFESQTEEVVYGLLREHAHEEVFPSDSSEPHLIGIVEKGDSVVDANVTDTLLDPDHDHWDRLDKPDTWVSSRGDAESRIEEAVNHLDRKGVLSYDTESTPEDYVRTEVREVQ